MIEPVRNSDEFLLHRKPSGFACANTKRKELDNMELLELKYKLNELCKDKNVQIVNNSLSKLKKGELLSKRDLSDRFIYNNAYIFYNIKDIQWNMKVILI